MERESNVNRQPKKAKAQKTPLPKSIKIKAKFARILSCQEAYGEIEIDSNSCKLI